MPTNVWHLTIDLSDVWDADLSFSEKRDIIVRKLRDSLWPSLTHEPQDFYTVLAKLADSHTVKEFLYHWESLYDLADEDRIWIATF